MTTQAEQPPIETLHRVIAALQAAGIEVALGGSGLLAAYGLVEHVRDWDLTSEDEPEHIEKALVEAGLPFEGSLGDAETYGTRWRILVAADDHDIDIMIGFSIRTAEGLVAIPTVVRDEWRGVPLGSLEAWLVAYRLMTRPNKADAIARYLKVHRPDESLIQRMTAEPLSDPVRAELVSLLDT